MSAALSRTTRTIGQLAAIVATLIVGVGVVTSCERAPGKKIVVENCIVDDDDYDQGAGEAVETPLGTSCVPGFAFAVFTNGDQSRGNNTHTDSYNSSVAPYAAGGCSGNVATNSSDNPAVTTGNPAAGICGTINTASGGTVGGSGSYTGPLQKHSTPLVLTPVVFPTLTASVAVTTFSSGTNAIAPNFSYAGGLICSGSGTVVTLSAGSYIFNGDVTNNHCDFQVTSGPVVVYYTGNMAVSNSATINAPSTLGLPPYLVFMTNSAGTVNLDTSGQIYAGLYAPNTAITLGNNTDWYGAIVGSTYNGSNSSSVHYDQAMATTSAGNLACAATEVSRSTPVVALGDATNGLSNTAGGLAYVVQGSFEPPITALTKVTTLASIGAFTFPYIKGHMRARLASTITTTGSSFSTGTFLFDAATTGLIPSPASGYGACGTANGTCRHIFTATATPSATTGVSFHPAMVEINDSTASGIGTLFTTISSLTPALTNYQAILHKVLDAKLGGVDRSTVAVIQPSTVAGSSSRPTMAYFGATDGMLHAVCASVTPTVCTTTAKLGTELWAFMPREQLALVPTNTTRVDGSIRVVDLFGDFNNPTTGIKSWRTVLFFQTGYSSTASTFTSAATAGATYAIDVTNPTSPVVLWEYTTPTSGVGSPDLGAGLNVAAGTVLIGGQPTNLAVIETNNGGTGTEGVFVAAVQAESGAKLWANNFGYLYGANGVGRTGSTATSPRLVPADAPVGAGGSALQQKGLPGGAVGVDLVGQGFITDFVFGDLYGDLWRINAADGTSRNGANTPLFSFTNTTTPADTGNKHPIGAPPAIYSNNNKQYAAFATGGYDDPTAGDTLWTTATPQYVIAAQLAGTGATISQTTTACPSCALAVNTTFATLGISGESGFSQLLVVGTQLFVTSDSTNINSSTYGSSSSTGHASTIDLLGVASSTTTTLSSGGSSLVANGSTLYSGSSGKQEQLAGTATTTGTSVDTTSTPKITRNLWLRTQ